MANKRPINTKPGIFVVMSSPSPASQPAVTPNAPPDFESALARMEAIVYELEEGRIGLAEALARYEEGVGLLRQCFGLLETAERRIELLTGVDTAGNPVVEPYDDTASSERAQQGTPRSRSRSSAAAKPAKQSRSVSSPTATEPPPESPNPPIPSSPPPQTTRRDTPSSEPTKMDVPGGLF
jgi:exodeoxyribonuclease VII small subunit